MPMGGTNAFQGLQPRLADHLLDDSNASACSNVYLDNGYLKPLHDKLLDRTFSAAPLTLWKWASNNYWMSFTNRVSIAVPVNPNVSRLYYTGSGVPKVAVLGTGPDSIFNGAGPYPNGNGVFSLGVVKPSVAPIVSITSLQPDTGRDYTSLDLETRYYCYTTVNEWGEESASSPISLQVSCYDDSVLSVTMYLPASSGYKPASTFRIYRTNTATSATAFQFVKEVPIATLVTTDNVLSSALSEVAETLLWEIPPVDLQNLTTVAGQFYAGTRVDASSGLREVCFSEVMVPYAWPLSYRFPVEDQPVGIAVNGTDLVVLTTGRPVVFVGNSPVAMQQMRLSDYVPCMSAASIAVIQGMVVYAGPDGLMGISSSQGFMNLTEEILTREQWSALGPANMKITAWERFLYISTPTAAYLFDLRAKTYWPITVKFDASFYDGYSDTLYIAQGTSLYKFNAGALLSYSWTSKQYLSPAMTFASARVNGLTFSNCTFEYLIDGVVKLKRRILNREPFRLPALRGRVMSYRLTGTDTVRSASIATTSSELAL